MSFQSIVQCFDFLSVSFELQIVEVLTESLTLKETPIPTKVARLMLVSDVLHNSSAPVKNASAYRTKFEATLPDIMESFNDLYRSITGRITAEALKVSCTYLFFLGIWTSLFMLFVADFVVYLHPNSCRNEYSKCCKYGRTGSCFQMHM